MAQHTRNFESLQSDLAIALLAGVIELRRHGAPGSAKTLSTRNLRVFLGRGGPGCLPGSGLAFSPVGASNPSNTFAALDSGLAW